MAVPRFARLMGERSGRQAAPVNERLFVFRISRPSDGGRRPPHRHALSPILPFSCFMGRVRYTGTNRKRLEGNLLRVMEQVANVAKELPKSQP